MPVGFRQSPHSKKTALKKNPANIKSYFILAGIGAGARTSSKAFFSGIFEEGKPVNYPHKPRMYIERSLGRTILEAVNLSMLFY